MKGLRNIVLIFIFTAGILFAGFRTMTKEPILVSLVENREMATFKWPSVSTVLDGSFQSTTDSAFSDQFMGRNLLMEIYKKMNNVLTDVAYLFVEEDTTTLEDTPMTLYPISEDGVFKVGKDGEYLVEFPYLRSTYYEDLIYRRIDNYNAVQQSHPELSMYLYRVTNARDTNWFDAANYVEGAGSYYSQWMKDFLDSRITYRETEYESWEDYKEKNYKTDHHWNVYGAYQGYSDIVEMVAEDYPEIGAPKESTGSYCSTAKFYGSLVKRSNFNLDENIYDTICDFDYDLKEHTVTVNGVEVEEFGQREAYRNNVYQTDKATNHYREFFGVDSAEVIYDFGENTGVNAIIFTDSYTNAIKPVLASHFDKTIYIDLRHYLSTYGDYFNLKKTMEREGIDVVVYVGSLSVIYMDESYNINYY